MTAITISDRITHAISERNDHHNSVLTSNEQLTQVEQQIARLEGGINAIAKKSFRSARYTLLQYLSSDKGAAIFSFQPPQVWEEDRALYKRLGINILFSEQYSEDEWTNVLQDQNISVVYVGTIQKQSLAIEDFSYILSKAHKFNIPVVFDNTYGGLGYIYSPLADGADFILTDVSASDLFKNNPIKAFIVEGAKGIFPNGEQLLSGISALDELKRKRVLPVKDTFIIAQEERFIEKLLTKEARRQGDYSRSANYLARWLYTQQSVMEINYAGLKSSESHIHAEMYFKGGYGTILKFSLWDNEYSYSILKGYFRAGKPKGLHVTSDHSTKEFIIELRTENYAHVLQYFQNLFSNLKQNVEFKTNLRKEYDLKKAVDIALNQMLATPQYRRVN